jgi:hypothetical protein
MTFSAKSCRTAGVTLWSMNTSRLALRHEFTDCHTLEAFPMLQLLCVSLAFLASVVRGLPGPKQHDSCASLRQSTGYVVSSSQVLAGELADVSAVAAQNVTESNNATFCRVIGVIPYGSNNTLNFEVWLPEAENYNERYLSVGTYEFD